MHVERTAPAAFTLTFDDEDELRAEHRVNLAFGALRLPVPDRVAADTPLRVTLRGPWGGELTLDARVVAALADGLALALEGDGGGILERLLSRPAAPPEEESSAEKRQNTWDRMRSLSQMEKILLAVKADRTERALLLQDNDPRVLLSILRNPRLTLEEVVRIAKSPFLNYQIADVLMQTAQWIASPDVRLGLVHNPKTPQAFALRLLPTLPEQEIRNIARGGTSMALKQAALRRLQGKP